MAEEWILLSEIEHWSYCPRQWALIHVEQCFVDDAATTRGHIAHERADRPGSRRRGDATTRWGLDVWSERLAVRGRCDRVVFSPDGPRPIEHKSGRRAQHAAHVQLAAQAMCLEEMFDTAIPVATLYLVATNELRDIEIDRPLRDEVELAVTGVRSGRARMNGEEIPSPVNDQRCHACSMSELCLGTIVASANRVRGLHGATFWP